MRVISNKALTDFAAKHPMAAVPLQDWRTVVEASFFESFADLRKAFRTVDVVGKYHVFDIGGNKYRIVAAIHFNGQRLYIRHVFTHKEYDQWNKLP
ncbi:type II toxin-antitoxin system HigB family toxin [Methylorubrum thiocyanatum]|uniref:type II toxin-antitoxin system HigB family toxin n=1 Tax=Methylorubrum thiocyanatum TaxID=47958 RepID=UPI003839EC75